MSQGWGQPPGGQGYGAPPGPQPYGQAYAQGQAPMQYGYEFTQLENQTVAKAATWAKALGIVHFVQAGLAVINLNVFGAGIDLAVGLSFYQGGKAFKTVVDTQGNDVFHMMQALDKISTAFMIRIVIVCLGVGLVLILLLLFITVGAAMLSG